MDYRSLRYTDEKSDKFWSIVLAGCSHTVKYGRYGTDGQTQTKEFLTEDAARKSYDKLVAEKLKKGYVDDSRSERLRQREASAPSIAATATTSTSVTSEPATNLLDRLPINWRELAFQEIQSHLVQNKKQLCELAAIDAIPDEYFKLLTIDVRKAIAQQNFNFPQIYARLAKDEHEAVRVVIASNLYTPPEILLQLAHDPTAQVRIAVCKNSSAPKEAIEFLANDPYKGVRKFAVYATSELSNIENDLLVDNSGWDRELRWYIKSVSTEHQNPDRLKELAELSESGDCKLLVSIACNPNTPPSTLEKLVENQKTESSSGPHGGYGYINRNYIVEAVALNPSTPPEILVKLAQRNNIFIALALAFNHSAPSKALEIVGLAGDLNLPTGNMFGVYAGQSEKNYQQYLETFYLALAHNPHTPLAILSNIASGKIKQANSSYTPVSILRYENLIIRNKFSPSEMARHNYRQRYRTLVQDTNISIESLEQMLKDRDSAIIAIVGTHPLGLPMVMKEMVNKLNTLSRSIALVHPCQNIDTLVQLSNSSIWFDRYAIAQNPSTPKDILDKLSEDEHLFVRSAARSALGLEVICSPVVETVEAIAIEDLQVITNPVVESGSIELKIERSIDLNPEDWLWVAGRTRESKPPSEPKPFELQDALNRLKQIKGEAPDRQRKLAGYFSIDWNKANIAPNLSVEEANFWLTAMTSGRPHYWNQENLDALVELLKEKSFKSLPDFRQVICILLQDWRSINLPILRPLNNLFSIVEIIIDIYRFHQSDDLAALQYIESVFDRDYLVRYAADRPAYSPDQVIRSMAIVLRNESRSLLDRLIQGFKSFIHPYLTDEEIRVMQQQLRPALNIQTNTFHLYKLAAYLGMDEEVRAQVATWQLNQPTVHFVKTATGHLQSIEAIEIVFGLGNPAEIETNVRNLNLPISKPEHIRGWFANMGFTALDLASKCILTEEQLAVFTLAKAPEVAPYMLELWLSLKKPQLARQWLEDYPIYAVVGLIPVVAGTWVDPVRVKPSELKKAAIDFLVSMKRKGHEPLIRSALERETPEIAAKVRSLILDVDEPNYTPFDAATTPQWLQAGILDLPKQKRSKPPAWVSYADLPPIVIGDRCLDEAQINACLSALSLSTLDSPLPLVQNLKTHANPQVLDTFSWSLFDRWLTEGAPNKEKWAMMALGLLGSDRLALKLTPLIRTWPGENQHPRAVLGLECLRAIGTDTALMQIHGIAQKIKFQGLKNRAQDCMAAIARDRHLTAEQLADRIIPDCGLDDRGQRTFDFGARQFQFLLGLDLKPMLCDPQGKKITTLPKPNSKDDPEQAERAIADWKLMKKQISEVAKLHSLRLERAMTEHRTWNWQDFETLLVRHPLLTHLVQRIIWATYDPQGTLQTTFRVAEDRTFTDAQDNPYQPDLQAIVGIPHPLNLDSTTKSLWGEILSDYEIIPPFPQLSRDTYALTDAERDAEEIDRFASIVIPGATLGRMMDSQGWLKGALHDHGDYQVHYKYFPLGDVTAIIGDYEHQHVEQSTTWGDDAMDGCLFLKGESARPAEYPKTGSWYARNSKIQCLKLGEVDRIVISEVIRDMNSIVIAAQAAR